MEEQEPTEETMAWTGQNHEGAFSEQNCLKK